jgi:hypothetical protein
MFSQTIDFVRNVAVLSVLNSPYPQVAMTQTTTLRDAPNWRYMLQECD